MNKLCFLVLMIYIGIGSHVVSADPGAVLLETTSQATSANKKEQPVDIRGFESPRQALQSFLSAMDAVKQGDQAQIDTAIRILDLSNVNRFIRPEVGRDLAWSLYAVMNRIDGFKLSRISSKKQQQSPYVFKKLESGNLTLTRQVTGRWVFEQQSIDQLPSILEELSQLTPDHGAEPDQSHLPWHLSFRSQLPDWLKDNQFLLELWQWLGILFTIILGSLADKCLSALLQLVMHVWTRWCSRQNYQKRPVYWLRPLGLMAMAGIWWLCLNQLGLPEEWLVVLLVAVKVLAGISGIWGGLRLVDLLSDVLFAKAQKTVNKLDDVLVPLLRKTLKVVVVLTGIIFILSNLNMNINGLFAGLGLGGLAFALAAKDTIQNLFGSVSVLLDQSFHVGDWVVIEEVEGTVEEVGLRSTRIRTFYDSQVVVPNSRLITATVDNMGKRRYRRFKTTLTVTYDTSVDTLEALCEGIRELIRINNYTRKDYYHVYFYEMADSYLGILIYIFFSTPDWGAELRERHNFLMNVMRLAEKMGVEFAFPSRTVIVKRDQTLEANQVIQMPEDREAIWQKARALARETMPRT
ncbi:MAG: mechanosensitive ion channel family protein [Gammaproteobacteria bacterium]|nr:mechanosensitive ion channel family protein [Gammaproteobacteria bacterium]